MKKKMKMLGVIAIALMIALTMVSCGGSDPKSLAKQTVDLTKQALANPLKALDLAAKAAKIQEKVEKLSDEDQDIYYEELARLGGGLF